MEKEALFLGSRVEDLHATEREIKAGQIYKHYKGNLYKVVAIAVDTEAEAGRLITITNAHRRVIYYALDNENLLWDRPYEIFAEKIIIDGFELWRFAECDMSKNDAATI